MKKETIINKQFSRAFMGYDPGEVDAFLDEIIRDGERKEQELSVAALRIKMLMDELAHHGLLEPKPAAPAGADGGEAAAGGDETPRGDAEPVTEGEENG